MIVPNIEDQIIDEDFDDVSEEKHRNLLEKITSKTSRKIQPSLRNEPSLEVSEFHFINKQQSTNVKDLADALKKKAPLIRQKIQVAKTTKKPLQKPLDKIHADKIKRAVAYENFKKHISRWSAVIEKNKASDQLKFPLRSSEVEVFDNRMVDFTRNCSEPTELQKTISNLLQSSDVVAKRQQSIKMSWIEKEKEKYPLTLKELLEKRKAMAKFRAQESYRHAKAHRLNKIKSKKYHRLLRKEKTKEQIKEFEKLQDTDPVAALEKLNEIEKTRAEERASLRHKSTGQWARNHVVRAKYDKESRIALAEQLRKSKELTQKLGPSLNDNVDTSDTDSDQDFTKTEEVFDPNNPWLADRKEFADFMDGYNKFVKENNEKDLDDNKEILQQKYNLSESKCDESSKEKKNACTSVEYLKSLDDNKFKHQNKIKEISIEELGVLSNEESDVEIIKIKNPKKKNKSSNHFIQLEGNRDNNSFKIDNSSYSETIKKNNGETEVIQTATGTWTISIENKKSKKQKKHKNVESVFKEVEQALKEQIDKKLSNVNNDLNKDRFKNKKLQEISSDGSHNKIKNEDYLKMPNKRINTHINEPLNENKYETNVSDTNYIERGQFLLSNKIEKPLQFESKNIDPTEFLQVKPINLESTEMAQIEECIDDTEKQEELIAEAFADDDIINEFKDEKKKLEEESKPKLPTALPGWGKWTGPNIKQRTFKRRPNLGFFRIPAKPPRKDFNREKVIIHENADDSLKSHMVSELPYPFKNVQEYEETIKVPVGQSWVPETVFRKLIDPPIITEMGQVINPIDENSIVKLKMNN
ncbi:U3 small nucleolar RNA-associated protein 14 homolog A [Daktulosphaira vitifoliae]|uniref:U3 small nucleolar RNA-associated protein 14 homolog A n=1 Tax=Daktulosphaira vitifoliae TaxID=58002 RepID=UPI0021AA1638|nr:U3 small nucleolar RNA-associated protein 14 homolog A [Daktulosphaira vitifoliae]